MNDACVDRFVNAGRDCEIKQLQQPQLIGMNKCTHENNASKITCSDGRFIPIQKRFKQQNIPAQSVEDAAQFPNVAIIFPDIKLKLARCGNSSLKLFLRFYTKRFKVVLRSFR